MTWPLHRAALRGGRCKKDVCGVDLLKLVLRGLLQLWVAGKTVRVPDLDEQAIGGFDLILRCIHRNAEKLKSGAAGTPRAVVMDGISARTGIHLAR